MKPLHDIAGWGRTSVVNAKGHFPFGQADASAIEQASPALPRGLGRSYGDASLPMPECRYLDTRHLDRLIAFDPDSGILEAESGVTLHALLQVFVPRGWFLPVTPGTQWVTLGGAVASNIHGKNHHHCGSIEHFVTRLEVVTPVGVWACSPTERPDLFRATVGGYGLTGLITRVSLKLKRIASPYIRTHSVRARNLTELFARFREHDAGFEYSVAWVDTLARGKALGRGLLHLGDHEDTAPPGTATERFADPTNGSTGITSPTPLLNVPFSMPSGLLQPWALRFFNEAYFRAPRSAKRKNAGYEGFFYPLDAIGNWNRLYGANGFFQYQFVIPDPDGSGQGEAGVKACLSFLARHGMGSFLAVLKRCGDDGVLLPFCRRGFTLALDIPHRGATTLLRLEDLDRLVLDYGGRVYLTKDARLPRDAFRAMYPEWKAWMTTVKRFNPVGAGRSLLSERLGLWEV